MIPILISAIEAPDDREFMERLYLSYHRLIYSEIRSYIDNRWDIEDVMQTVLVNLIRHISKLRELDRDQRVNYIIVTARHTSFNYIRDNKKKPVYSYDETQDWLENDYVSEETRLEQIELKEDLRRAWRALDERSRRVLEMRYMLGSTNEEIAAEFHVKPDSVRMLLTRARKNMKEILKQAEMD